MPPPLPSPKKGESKKAFHSRCMADETSVKDFKDIKQRNAVCYQQWTNKGKK